MIDCPTLGNNWYISDFHFNHAWVSKEGEPRGVIYFERTQFKTIEDHDEFIINKLREWALRVSDNSNLWVLGDFGDTSYLREFHQAVSVPGKNLRFYFVRGNHEFAKDIPLFEQYFDKVYSHPVFLTDRVILSHQPLWPLPFGTINLAGHLHGAKLDSPNHYIVSANNINYQPVSDKLVNKMLARTPRPDYHFLKEPFAEQYIFLKEKDDVVYDKKTKKIDLPASLKKFYN